MQTEKRELEVLIENPWMLAVAIKKWYTGRDTNAYIYMTFQRKYCLRGRKKDELPYRGEDKMLKWFQDITTWNHKSIERQVKKLELRYPMKLKVIM